MSDFHVNTIRYEFKGTNNVYYQNCPPLTFKNNDFELTLDKDILSCKFLNHFSEVSDAEAYIKPFLNTWIIYCGLEQGREEFSLKFKDADVVDRDPPPPGSVNIKGITAIAKITVNAFCEVSVGRCKYPSPPIGFVCDPDIEVLWKRYKLFKASNQDNIHLLAIANFFLTYLEGLAHTRKNAAKLYKIDFQVLHKIGELAGEKGDKLTARKANIKGQKFDPLSGKEIAWIDKCIRMMIRRLGEYKGGVHLKQISMTDLPPL